MSGLRIEDDGSLTVVDHGECRVSILTRSAHDVFGHVVVTHGIANVVLEDGATVDPDGKYYFARKVEL
jgi:sugar lactone lactonase YvrE